MIDVSAQMSLLQRHCHLFDPADTADSENKLEYTEVFDEYTSKVEDFIGRELGRRIRGFDMKAFLRGEGIPKYYLDAFDWYQSWKSFTNVNGALVLIVHFFKRLTLTT